MHDGSQRPEMAMFHALGIARGWTTEEKADEPAEIQFLVELGNDDACTFFMQYDRFEDTSGQMVGGLSSGVFLYNEGDPVPADPDALAARLAGWLRTLADQLSPAPATATVPREPTRGMFMAGGDVTTTGRPPGARRVRVGDDAAAEVWRRMLAVAVAEGGEGDHG